MAFKVYALLDDKRCILGVQSSRFNNDTTGWTLIDEGEGDRYMHAGGNYLPKSIADYRDVSRYRVVDDESAPFGLSVVERTQEEMDEEYASLPEPEPTTEELLLEMTADHEYRICLMELGVSEDDL